MKNNPILRWILIGLVHLTMYLLGCIVTPLLYWSRGSIRENKDKFYNYIAWLFLNDSTANNDEDVDWGDYGRYSHNWLGFVRQSVIRNSHWNFRRTYFIPEVGDATLLKSYYSELYIAKTDKEYVNPLMLCNIDNYWGKQYCKFSINDTLYFRCSFTVEVKYINYVINMQLGMDNERYLYKFRIVSV